jgi:hypothetical protein
VDQAVAAFRQAMLLADAYYLVAHDDVTGQPRAGARAVGLGVAAAVLGELILTESLDIQPGGKVWMSRHQRPADRAQGMAVDFLDAEQHPLRTWLEFFSSPHVDLAAQVAERLERRGILRRVERRKLLRTQVGWVPVDTNFAAMPAVHLWQLFSKPQPVEQFEQVICGLVVASGLAGQVWWDRMPTAELDYYIHHLPVPFRELVKHLEAAVAYKAAVGRA